MNTIVLIGLMFGPASASDLALDYKKCVEEFAISQIRSGESAEILVRAGEAECTTKLSAIKDAVRADIRAMPSTRDAYKALPKAEVDKLVEESADERLRDYREASREAALRNVVFLKARLNEQETK